MKFTTWRPVDGIGMEHASLEGECCRCGEIFQLGCIHRPKFWKEGEEEQRQKRRKESIKRLIEYAESLDW